MRRLTHVGELLDGPLDEPDTLRNNLRDMGRANQFLGGIAISRRAIESLLPGAPGGPLTLLDVGTGGADIPLKLLTEEWRAANGMHITAVDNRPEVVDAARALNPCLARTPNLSLAIADGMALPYPDGAFDVAHSSMVLHHLEPPEAIAFLRELRRVARVGVVVNDLGRRPITVLGAWLLSHLFTRNRYTRHDAPLSARRAYTLHEAEALLIEAALRPVSVTHAGFRHRWAIAAVPR